jgi:hypothetical protein
LLHGRIPTDMIGIWMGVYDIAQMLWSNLQLFQRRQNQLAYMIGATGIEEDTAPLANEQW